MLAFIGSIGLPEVVVIMVVALLLFGQRLPQVARSFGKSITEFKKGLSEVKDDIERETGIDEVKKELREL